MTCQLKRSSHDDFVRHEQFEKLALAPRGCLVRVTSVPESYSPTERWFAVGIYFQSIAEAAVCNLPEIEPTDAVFAFRRLQQSEIVTLDLRREQIALCNTASLLYTLRKF